MSTNGPTDGKSTVPDRFAQTDCQDCDHDREHHSGMRALEQAQDHADTTGHTIKTTAPAWNRPVTVVGALPTCEDCDEPVQARVDAGPAEETKQLCGCTPVGCDD